MAARLYRHNGEVIFAVGDVHGCAYLLDALLNAFGVVNTCTAKPPRLVFLGDLINRGPETIKTLQRWADEAPIPGISTVDRLMGNHEQLLLLATQRGASSKMAYDMILQCGGEQFLQELREATGMPDAGLGDELLRSALSAEILDRLQNGLKASVVIGNFVFVHAGLDQGADQNDFLSLPADKLPKDGRHWAWIEEPFRTWRGGFDGRIVVHGHVPPSKRYAFTHQNDPHILRHGRLGLDRGSASTGIVTGAQIEDLSIPCVSYSAGPSRSRRVSAGEGQARVPSSSQVSAKAGQVDSSWGLFGSVRVGRTCPNLGGSRCPGSEISACKEGQD